MNKSPKIITTILIVLFFLPSFAQELKTKKVATDIYLEIFTIDKKSKLKNGEYLKINSKSRDTLISGTFRDDIKSGVWKYNSRGTKPWITYDYDKKMLARLSDEINKIDSFMIRKGDTFISDKVDSPPLYIGYKDEINQILWSSMRLPFEIFENKLSVITVASFVVDRNGKMKDFQIIETSSKEVISTIFDAYKKIEGDWSPAIYNGQPIDSEVFIVFDLKPEGATLKLPKISNAIVVSIRLKFIEETKIIKSFGSSVGRSVNHR